jgi:hypothetical protein
MAIDDTDPWETSAHVPFCDLGFVDGGIIYLG